MRVALARAHTLEQEEPYYGHWQFHSEITFTLLLRLGATGLCTLQLGMGSCTLQVPLEL
jgi:hypothetical protein